MNLKSILILFTTIAFLCFFGYVIYAANTKSPFFVFQLYKHIPFGDKIGHFSLMLIFSFLLNSSLNNKRITIRNIRVLIGSVILLIFITIEEFTQLGIETRNFDLVDLAFNYLGIYCGGLLNTKFKLKSKQPLK